VRDRSSSVRFSLDQFSYFRSVHLPATITTPTHPHHPPTHPHHPHTHPPTHPPTPPTHTPTHTTHTTPTPPPTPPIHTPTYAPVDWRYVLGVGGWRVVRTNPGQVAEGAVPIAAVDVPFALSALQTRRQEASGDESSDLVDGKREDRVAEAGRGGHYLKRSSV
jgi:hypothetical protein